MAHINTFAGIPIQVLPSTQSDALAMAKALLHELHAMVEALVAQGETGTIDLRALPPMGTEGYQFLLQQLGVGEVSARIDSFGRSEIQETAYPGIWRITHYNQNEELLTEIIQVTLIPELLKSHREDIVTGQERLGKRLQELSGNQ